MMNTDDIIEHLKTQAIWDYESSDGETKTIKETNIMLAILLLDEKVFTNEHWWEDDWPEEAKKTTSLNVNCNDVFAWGCADAEEMRQSEIEDVYEHWLKDRYWGVDVWCIKKRKTMPQGPVEEKIRKAGIWDLDALAKEHNFTVNAYDTVSKFFAETKYNKYCEWVIEQGKTPLVFDGGWWQGWREYEDAHPNYTEEQWYIDMMNDTKLEQLRSQLYNG